MKMKELQKLMMKTVLTAHLMDVSITVLKFILENDPDLFVKAYLHAAKKHGKNTQAIYDSMKELGLGMKELEK